jgi:hypothetical protein
MEIISGFNWIWINCHEEQVKFWRGKTRNNARNIWACETLSSTKSLANSPVPKPGLRRESCSVLYRSHQRLHQGLRKSLSLPSSYFYRFVRPPIRPTVSTHVRTRELQSLKSYRQGSQATPYILLAPSVVYPLYKTSLPPHGSWPQPGHLFHIPIFCLYKSV